MRYLRRVVRTRPRPRPPRPPRGTLATVRWGVPAFLVLALALALGACGGKPKSSGVASLNGSSGNATATTGNTTQQTAYQQALAFARCMRQHGIDVPDPKLDASGGLGITQKGGANGKPVPKAKMDAAQQACQQYAPRGKRGGHASQAQLQRALAFARCMRQHGVDMPDPKIDSDGSLGIEIGGRTDQTKLQAAQSACQSLMPGGPGGRFQAGG
jgi:hypothetical protein